MFNSFKRIRNEKGQGLTEYVLVFAFIGSLAFMMFSGDGLLGTMKNIVNSTQETFATLFDGENKYITYFNKWHDKTSTQLKQIDKDERITADQEALAIIARAFIGLDEEGVGVLIASLTGRADGSDQFNNMGNYQKQDDNEGYSGVMVPLSYQKNSLDSANGYIWLNQNPNIETVKMLAPNATVYDRDDPNNPSNNGTTGTNKHETVLSDRIFYSDDMISQKNDNANYRMVTVQVHYNSETNKVDSAKVALLKTQDPAKMNTAAKASHLYLNVTKTSYTEISD